MSVKCALRESDVWLLTPNRVPGYFVFLLYKLAFTHTAAPCEPDPAASRSQSASPRNL